jgi:sugar transferase (PEP-CTERM/EpsH1 system associated)
VVHVVHRFDFGGLENGLVNLVNLMPADAARHVIVAMTEASDICSRITRTDVRVVALGKRPGQDPAAYVRLYRLLREIRPQIVHTRNVGTLDCQLVAWLARVPTRIHGEHGWDTHDPEGKNPKYRAIRRALAPLVHCFVALSRELETWIVRDVGIAASRVVRICNGVDITRFGAARTPGHAVRVIGSVTRFNEIKDPLNTVSAFIELCRRYPGLRLLMVGDGPLLEGARSLLDRAGLEGSACLPGAVVDVAPYLAGMDVFVLGSRREGISNTVLEAMAAGMPVVATAVGGNLELVEDGVTGYLVPAGSPSALAAALGHYVNHPELIEAHGQAGRRRVESHFSMAAMIDGYTQLYRAAQRPT